MKFVIFGLTISSSWGNGHATLWSGLARALAAQGHLVIFFERDVPYYANARDLTEMPGKGRLVLYGTWQDVRATVRAELEDADVAIITSYCPDALEAEMALEDSPALRVFYDLDTPVTLAQLRHGVRPAYIGPNGLALYDLVLSYTGGKALAALREELGAPRVEPLFGHVDPSLHRPVAPLERYRCDLSYLGTFADDRQSALQRFFIAPAQARPLQTFLIGGAGYPKEFPWTDNIYFARHLPPGEHPAFFSSSRLTLNVTRKTMADMGWCPSGRLFEAAACGAPLVSDTWEGLDSFFTPGREILVVRDTPDVLAALEISDGERTKQAKAARDRVLAEHTSAHRARELLQYLEVAAMPQAVGA